MNAAIPSFPEPIYQTHDPLKIQIAAPVTLHMKFIDKVRVLISPRGPAFPGYSQPFGRKQ